MDPRFADIPELGAALRRGQVSPQDLAEAAINGLATLGVAHNAVATLLPDRARTEAAKAAERLAAGDAEPLVGIPYAVKDLFSARGGPTTWGSQVFAERVIDDDAVAIRHLRSAGGVLTAKLAMSEFAGGGRPVNPGASMHGQGRNPWNPTRYSGGSSSGSGIAVALGVVPFALGTETGGSTLGPAGFSGVTGLRPTYGLVARGGAMTLSWTLDKIGVLARTADDIGTVLTTIAGPKFSPLPAADLDKRLPRLRIAWLEVEIDEASPSIRAPLAAAVEAVRALGATLVDTGIRRDLPLIEPLELIVKVEGGFELRDLLRDPAFRMSDDRQLATLRSGLETPAADYLEAIRVAVPGARRAFDDVFADIDVILSASRVTVAPSLTEERPPRDATKMSDLLRAAGNLAGVPGISFPVGLSEEGLPVGLQAVGPRGSDALLIALASAFQRATDHHRLRPPVAAG